MANEEQLSILKQGVEVWNKWRKENLDVEINLSGANLFGVDLNKANFFRANLSEANLRVANLEQANLNAADLRAADLSMADLTRANLIGTNLSEAHLRDVDLSEANLSEAELGSANLTGSILNGTNLSLAKIGYTNFGTVDLRVAIALNEITHFAPSNIATHALTRSTLCVYNSETTPPNNLESRAEEKMRCLRTQMVV